MTPEIDAKRLELLKELVPGTSRVAVLANPANPNNKARIREMKAAAKALRLTLTPIVEAGDSEQLEKGFGAIVAARSQGLILISDRALLTHRDRIVEFAMKRRLPGLYAYREFVEAGGLASYAPSYSAMFRRAAMYVDKILKGAKPGELPIEQPTKFELVINLKTAKALGHTIPQSVLSRADEVIHP
jgi:putative ABC transport system substrate-binding protein